MQEQELLETFIRECLEETGVTGEMNLTPLVTEKKKRHHKKKKLPGGPRTDAGATKHLHPEKFAAAARAAMNGADGDVAAAARKMGVAKRTMYHYLETTPALRGVKTSSEISDE